MDQHHFAALTRTVRRVPSRRDVLRGLAGAGLGLGTLWLPGIAAAKRKGKKNQKKKHKTKTPSPSSATCTPKCGRKLCGDDGCGGSCGSCAAEQACASGTCCTPEPREVTCVVDCGYEERCPKRCDTVRSPGACGQVACTCPSGEACLGNSTCAIVCAGGDCRSGCACDMSTDGAGHCYDGGYCDLFPQVCTSSGECPLGHACRQTMCGPGPTGSPENRCWGLCGFFGN